MLDTGGMLPSFVPPREQSFGGKVVSTKQLANIQIMPKCKQCGRPIRVGGVSAWLAGGKHSYGDVYAVKQSIPFWMWLLPIPIISGWLLKAWGPNFCGDGCKMEYQRNHPKGWVGTLIKTHIIYPVVVGGLFFLATHANNGANNAEKSMGSEQPIKNNKATQQPQEEQKHSTGTEQSDVTNVTK